MSNIVARMFVAALAGLANGANIQIADATENVRTISRGQLSDVAKTFSLAPTFSAVSDSPNRQRKLVKIHQRAAIKASNQRRHRKQCK